MLVERRAQKAHETERPSWLELERVIGLVEAARFRNVSVDTLKRNYADKIVELSPRRRGMKLRHALGIE
jgi:hypothetical protein